MNDFQIQTLLDIAHQYLSHEDRNVRMLALATIDLCDREKRNKT